jgi:cation transport regulator ChaC
LLTNVRQRFRNEFTKPPFKIEKELVAPPLSTRHGTVGTAFDYLFRFVIKRLNRSARDRSVWVAEEALPLLVGEQSFLTRGKA